jgi:adenylosuccinate synthase
MAVDVLIGAQWGDEGKGNISSFLALLGDYDIFERDCSPQAGHISYRGDKRICLAHLPAGVINPKSRCLLGTGSFLYLPDLLREIQETGITPARLGIDRKATMVTAENRAEEQQNQSLMGKTGSIGSGVGPARSHKIMERSKIPFAGDILNLKPYITDTREELYQAISNGKNILLEGDHGAELDLTDGQHPVVTSRNTNACQFLSDCGIGPLAVKNVYMIMKPYTTASFADAKLEKIISDEQLLDWGHDITKGGEIGTKSKRLRRMGEVEWNRIQRVIKVNTVTQIAVTHLDSPQFGYATKENITLEVHKFLDEIKERIFTIYPYPKIAFLSFGPKPEDTIKYSY